MKTWSMKKNKNNGVYTLPGGWVERVQTMKAMEAARATLLASQLGPNSENAMTPMAAQPI